MGYDFFGRRNRRPHSDKGTDATSEFAATVATPPPDFAACDLPIDDLEGGFDDPTPSGLMDSQVQDSQIRDSDLPGADAARDAAEVEADTVTKSQPTLSHVGRYALKSRLGQGGLGQVHEAWDPLLSRTVAVKTLQFDLPEPLRVSLDGLILNEARAAASLNHAYIVTVFDAGLSAHGVYIAMERLQGRDLRHALASGWVPSPRAAAALVRRVADALAYAHARGVVHCDIKPANIFLVGRDRPKVLDFGIARIANGTAVPALDGTVAGSPYYQSPEQVRGQPVDARTDLYALGTVLYELLTGRKAFGGDSVEQIQTAVMTLHPAPAHEVRPGVPTALAEIAAKAMARDPAERFASATEMSAALRRWGEAHARASRAAETATAAVPAATRKPVKGTPRRLRPILLLGAVLAAAGLGFGLLRPAPPAAGELAGGPAAPLAVAATSGATGPAVRGGTPETAVAAAGSANDAADIGTEAGLGLASTGAGTALQSAPAPALTGPASTRVTTSGPTSAPNPTPRPTAGTTAATAAKPRPATPRANAPAATARPAAATGTVQLAISPWGRVEVDGRPAGTTPPLTRLTLSEGPHTITVLNEDFPPFVTTVQVQAEKPATLRHRFGP